MTRDDWDEKIEDRLRRRVLLAFHRGSRGPGDRLPGVRDVSRELGVDHRAVARAYRALEAEGLVEIRPRSGVFLAPHGRQEDSGPATSETMTWLSEVLYQAWQRGLTWAGLTETLTSVVGAEGRRVLCLESVPDPLEALSAEAESVLGVPCDRFLIDDPVDPSKRSLRRILDDPPDLAFTTVYHARHAKILERAGVPTLVVTTNPEWVATLQRWASDPALTVVVTGTSARDRIGQLLGAAESMECLLVEELPPPQAFPADRVVYATVGARRQLSPEWASKVRVPMPSLIAPRSIRDLFRLLIAVGSNA